MNKYIEFLDNIKAPEDLKERTVASMINSQKKVHRFYTKKMFAVIITVIVLATLGTFTVIAYTNCIYDPDALNFKTEYIGNGIVEINVYNGTEKDVKFQKEYKLCRWTTGELEPISDEVCDIETTTCKSKKSITIKIDLNNRYDVKALEKEVLVNDWYYIIITDKNFIHEHDWHCSFRFNDLGREQEEKLKQELEEKKEDAEKNLLSSGYYDSIDPKYMFYFDNIDKKDEEKKYLDMVAKDIENLDGNYVSATLTGEFPKEDALIIKNIEDQTFLDKKGLKDTYGNAYFGGAGMGYLQDEITHKCILGESLYDTNNGERKYNYKDGCLQINVLYENNIYDGHTSFPVFYMVSYKTSDIKSPEDYCFIHGKFYQFKDLEDLKVFEDENYTIYNINQFLFTDPEQYIRDYMLNVKKGEEERYYQRALNVYNYFNENISDCFEYNYYEKADEN